MGKNKLLLFCLCLFSVAASAQTTVSRKYLVLLKDKANSPYAVSRPQEFLSQRAIDRRTRQGIAVVERDLPVNPSYVAQLKQAGATVRYTSRWMNAALVEATDAVLTRVLSLSFVKGLEFNRSLAGAQPLTADPNARMAVTSTVQQRKMGTAGNALAYGLSRTQLTQIGIDKMHAQGYRGEGMLIALLDAGFRNANRVPFLTKLFSDNRVVATKDFVENELNVYDDDAHGLNVLSILAATSDSLLYGAAFNASYVLIETEDVRYETQIEEANWLLGAEFADSTGADVLSSSLGYTQFDDYSTSYTYAQLNGKTALSTRAAQIASETGMVIVVSAGNEGNDPWRYISAPSDAAGVLAIGAVDAYGVRAAFSSFGPSADGRVKPDVAAFGLGTIIGLPTGVIGAGSGTSYSGPLVAGLVAGFWQANPTLKATDVVRLIRESGSRYTTPDASLGYGIPNFSRATLLALPVDRFTIAPNPVGSDGTITILWPNPAKNATIDLTLTDAAGRAVWRSQAKPDSRMTLTLPQQVMGLPTGIYYLSLLDGDQKQTLRLLKP
ncbi:S8 family peptidase [Arsenicibacter rosenii]|uniref:Peptidase S8 n=1 Tax=Arsenicibacter rosenii TaxID=1750698 RepID=A0A1S2VHV9_9BACT|nr:S8 family peptidase [Arsenicibacter rosenii]OIN57448.1 peptidase S8 [Arsenicibacter rosenii]